MTISKDTTDKNHRMRHPELKRGVPREVKDHIVIINVNEKLPSIVEDIQAGWSGAARPLDIVIFVQDRTLWENHVEWHPVELPPNRLFIVEGCPGNAEELNCAHVDTCHTAVILADPSQGDLSDARTTLTALAIERQNPTVHTLIEVVTSGHREHIAGTEVNEVVCMGELTEKLLAQSVISPGMLNIVDGLLSEAPDHPSFTTIPVPDSMQALTYRDAVEQSIRDKTPYTICGYVQSARISNGKPLVEQPFINPDEHHKNVILKKEDALIIAC